MQGLQIRWAAAAAIFLLLIGMTSANAAGMSAPEAASPDDDFKMAVQHVEAKEYGKAIGHLEDVLRLRPQHADALNYMGYSHRKLGDYGRAVAYYKKALAVDPNHRGANEYLGEAHLELNNLPAAEEQLAKLRQICGGACPEHDQLAKSIAAYKAGKKPQQSSSRRW